MYNQSYQSLINTSRLSNNEDFYNNVFKKTERIISAIGYILSFIESDARSKGHIASLMEVSSSLHKVTLESLSWFEHESHIEIYRLQHALVILDSTVRVATAGRVLGVETTESILLEVDNVLRYIKNHFTGNEQRISAPATTSSTKAESRPTAVRRPRTVIPKNDLSSDAVLVYSQLNDRVTRIKTVLEAKPEATIKDITDIITDVSAKTIQRDLNAMIESGEVVRQGERRWSKYSIAK
ncbi:MAG: hypothetical protein ACK42D_01135 [Candidatus Paceibacteria bacterium]